LASPDSTVHELFAEQARRTPHAVALAADATDAEEITYAELERRSNRLARRLVTLGVGAEVRVGLCLDRSLDRVVATLAILKAGGAYVPLDPNYPAARLDYLLRDTGARVVIADERGRSVLPPTAAALLSLDLERESLARESPEPLTVERSAGPDGLAYVIYTSGSTGLPKGVAVRHRSIVELVTDCRYAHLGPDEVLLQLSPFSFDPSTFEIWGALLNGARLVMPPPGTLSLAAIGEIVARHRVTTLWLTSGLFHQMVETDLEALRPLRQLLAGGDALSAPRCRRVLAELPGTRLINGYGPTESTTFAACAALTDPAQLEPSVSIGVAIPGTTIDLLDRDFSRVAPREAGEISIGGRGLARGYLDRPALTAERFVPNPFGAPGERLYRTGDLARFRAGGELEFLGRIDGQLKVRGFRIEPEEVEAALLAHPQVRDAAVLVLADHRGDKQLAACLVLVEEANGRENLGAELRPFLGARLPEHLVPSLYLALPELPLTANEKVDRRALARPDLWAEQDFPAPAASPQRRDPVHELLAGIWTEALGRPVGNGDAPFLALGGHSLQATRALARVRAALGATLPVSALLEAPSLAAFAAQVAQELAAGRPPLPPIEPRAVRLEAGEPLSSGQRRLWFLDRLDPGSPAHNIPLSIDLDGSLSPAILERSLDAVAARQESLRTVLDAGADGEPVQIVGEPALRPLPLLDLATLPLARRDAERLRLTHEEARRPFDLSPGSRRPLWRAVLLRSTDGAHRLLATFHHAIFDGESIAVLERELAAVYPALLVGGEPPLPPLAVQPADVAAWQRRWLDPGTLAPHLAYFRERLAGAPAALDLPADRPRPARHTGRGVSREIAIPAALDRGVRELARRAGATTFMTLLAVWAAFLRRVTGQDDLVVGSVLAHRDRPELEELIGFFVNTLPLRVASAGDPPFLDLLGTVRAAALGLYAHQDLPLERLLDELRPAGGAPLLQAVLALHGNGGPRELARGLTMAWREEETGAAQFDLLLDLEERPEGLAGRLVASADLFTPATVERLARGWETLLAGAVATPEALVSDLPLLSDTERQTLLADWGRSGEEPAWGGSVPARIAALASADPEAIAVLPADPAAAALTYGELASRAGRLARHLRARGVGRDVLVGVYAERVPETLIGLLAVLAAGGAFLPLDPAFPPERLEMILADARTPLLLARRDLAATLPTGGAEVVLLDEAPAPPSPPAGAEALPAIEPGDLAYVIYTSGSTGRPKGVLIPHRGFLWAVEGLAARSRLGPEARVLQTASASFDASVWETWSALISGSTLVLGRREEILPGAPLLATLRERGITNMFLPPSALAAMPEGASRELPDLVSLVVGGEASSPELVARWAPGRRLWNAYGPTEASICATMARLGEDGETPIGRPIADNRLLVLGRHGELLPPGVPGELHLGGRGLARGYLGRPDLTAAAFVPDRFSAEAGARLYRTGDLVRFRSDGQLEFLGRADLQVKVRGFRVEPGEIEAQIAEHSSVREVAVVPYAAAPGDLRLAAYLVMTGGDPSLDELRAFLRARLPAHMVPSAFRVLPAMPLAPSGKIDRRALPPPLPPDKDEASSGEGFVPPGTPAEELLAGIWGEVLGRSGIGAGDDFFDLGGHSLLVGRVLARVRAAFGVELPVRAAFEARTLAALAARIAAGFREDSARPPLVRAARAEAPPLSFAQQRLWFLDRLEPGSALYNLPVVLRLAGPLDAAALERAVDEVFRRHEALRTAFTEGRGDEPRQVVAPFQPAGLPRIDLSGLPAVAARAEAERLAAREALRPFDLARGPLARASLLRLGVREHRLFFFVHHVAFDGWSVEVLRRELGALYSAFVAGNPSPLAEPELQYGDFAVWQRRWLAGAALEAQLAYWRQRLTGAPPLLELPADRPRPPLQSFRGATLPLVFPEGLAAALRALARSEGATLFMTGLAAFSALLGRFTGQTDLVVGAPVANRSEAGIEGMIGFFVNTLALRADLGGDPPFRALLGRVRESALAAWAHQDLPFERLVEELQPDRDPSRSPLFQVLFSLDPSRGSELAPSPQRISCELLRVDTRTAKFDLSLFLDDGEPGLTARLEYATDLFDPATVMRLGRSFRGLLAGLVEDGAGLKLSALPLLGDGERWQIVGEWNEPGPPQMPAEETCLYDLVAAQMARTPEATALVFGGERLTYRELGGQATRMARRLAALGVGPEVRVAICLSRTPALVATLLGIVQAGGAYVPLDPSYPSERLGFMLDDAGPAVLVTERALAPRLPACGAHLLVLDGEDENDEDKEDATAEAAPRRPLADNLAYLIYTSGSTGRPKAVAIAHRNAVALVRWSHAMWSPAELAAVLGSTSISFDMSVFELFATLSAGGRVVLVENILALAELPADCGITLINTVPSALAAMTEVVRALPPMVRAVNLGGEPLKGALAQALYTPGIERVVNLYGPSEDTTYSTFEVVEKGSRREPTVGRAITGSWIRLLDRDLALVPLGAAGEVYLGGAGLARGYFGRPELTAARFVPDPLPDAAPGARLYRTSDLARFLPDGRLDYLGRLDHQVKVRGFRIELGEIEAALTAIPGVREAVVVALGEAGGDRTLAAYFVAAEDGPAPTAAELRDALRARLAEPMVPSSFTLLARLPLSPNGKVDRKALPAPDAADAAPEAGQATPRAAVDPRVEILAGIWAEVLGRDDLPGPDESFFELGGHSLLATRVVSRIRAALGIELPLRALFAAPTLAALAAAVAARQDTGEGTVSDLPITAAADRADLPLSFSQQRLWLLDQLEPGSPVYNLPQPFLLRGPLDSGVLEAALGEVARRHEVLRTTFVAAGAAADGEPRLVVAAPGAFQLPRVDLTALPEPARTAEAVRLNQSEAAASFDLLRGPLFRATLLLLGPEEHHLLLSMHHVAGDGWSIEVLLGELAALYQAFVAGRPSPLQGLAIQYADYAAWQRQWLAGPLMEAQLAYWRRRLAGAPEALDLPTDKPRPAVETSNGALLTRALPSALAAAARALSRRHGATLFMTLLAAFAAQLQRYAGADDLLLGSPVANRGRTEIEGLVGFFVNLLVLRVDLAGEPDLGTLLARVRETALGAYAHQDVPFERLVEELAPQRSLARSPLFQVQLVLGVGERARELAPGLPMTPLPVENRTAKYDLTLGLDVDGDGLLATLEYRTDLFETPTMVRWLGHFEALLGAMAALVESPSAPVLALPFLALPERQILLHEWTHTPEAADTPETDPGDLIHGFFERQARRTPEAIALVTAGTSLTYAGLDAAANRLARHLRALGVGPEVPVAVCLERNAELVVALFAILKAGGAYVPIDPAYPQERRKVLLADSRAAFALTSEKLLPLLAGSAARAVCLDRAAERAEIAALSAAPLPALTSAGNLAYLIYTSGSTGRPKGVAIEHRSVAVLIHWTRATFSPAELAAVLGSTSICFDMSVFEIFGTLAWGGSVHLVDNALALAALPAEEKRRLTLINTVPSVMAELVQLGAMPPTVRTVNLGGEAVPQALVDRLFALGTVGRVINLYGPSEDTTYSTWVAIPRGTAPTIGRTVTGSRAYVVDRRSALAPLGIPGEVVLAGAGLSRGYYGRPELTAERFLPDPFASEPGGRIYRTGDLARHLPGGELDYLGRIDHQVKLRGFRIELGEVEAVLAAHPAVERAVAGTHAFGLQDVRLVAWVTPVPEEPVEALDGEALRAWVGERLPEFMVPSAVVTLAAFPLNPNGKVDRGALPPPAAVAPAAASESPRTPLEELLAGLWAELLSLSRVGPHDDFFALGGHSLLAIRLLARLRIATGVELPLRALFAHPTVAALAAEVERTLRAPDSKFAAALPPIEPAGTGDEAPASSAQERLWYFHQLDPGGAVLNVPHPLRLTGPLRPAALAATLAEIGRRHAALRTTFAYGDGGLRQRIAPAGAFDLPLADLRALPPARQEEEARRAADEEARQPFDLAAGPLWRARLLALSGEEHRLLLTFHHSVADGWSTELFDRELAALYPYFAGDARGASPLPEPTLQYADFAAWQRRWISDETLAPQLAYWRRQLAGMPPALDLPADFPRPARPSFRGAARHLALDAGLSAALLELVRREGSTLFITAFAAFAALLGRYAGREDVVLGSPAANRHRPGTEGLFGFFVDNLVLRPDLAGDPTFRALLARAREVALGAYAHPDVPFDRLVEELDPVRDKSRSPLFQVMLLAGSAGAPLEFAGMRAEPAEAHSATAQFDLTVSLAKGIDGIALAAEYATDLFTAETIDRLLGHFARLLAAVVADPQVRLSALPAEIAPRPRLQAMAAVPAAPDAGPSPENDRAARQALLAERRARLAGAEQELLLSRLRKKQ
jgi:amino acid adenylation domain-containing protein